MTGVAWPAPSVLIASVLGGVALGLFHYLALRRDVEALLEAGKRHRFRLPRPHFLAVAIALAGIARQGGAAPLLAATLGLYLARTAVLRWKGVA